MIIDNKYEIRQTVYLKTDEEQLPRIITAIQVNPDGLKYAVINGIDETWHYEFELSLEKNYVFNNNED